MPDSVRLAGSSDAAALHRIAALTFPLACTPQAPEEEKHAFIAEQLTEGSFARPSNSRRCTSTPSTMGAGQPRD